MAEALRPPPIDWTSTPWEAHIRPSRFGYWITWHNGLLESAEGSWRRTRKAAERVALRGCRSRDRDDADRDRTWTVKP